MEPNEQQEAVSELRERIKAVLEDTRKLGDEFLLPDDQRLAIETTGEGWLNAFNAFFTPGPVAQGQSAHAGQTTA